MARSMWRPRAKIVAIIDIVSVCMGIIWAILVASAVVHVLSQKNTNSNSTRLHSEYNSPTNVSNTSDDIKPKGPLTSHNYWFLGVFAVLCVLFLGVQLLASIKLFNAATIGEDPKKARGMAVFWRNITMAVLILFCMRHLSKLDIFWLIITIVWRGSALVIVQRFIRELESLILSSENPVSSQADDVDAAK